MTAVQSIERAFAVLRALSGGPAGVTDLAGRVALPKSTVSRLLATLVDLGMAEQDPPGGPYRLGSGIAELSAAVRPGRSLSDAARPHLVRLRDQTGESTGLSILDGRTVLYLDQVESDNPVLVRDWTGQRVEAHLVSSGLVLLAFAPRTAVKEYLDRPLDRATPHSITEHRRVRDRLESVVSLGYAWVYDEYLDGITSVAAPVRGPGGAVVAAVHAHGPSYRFPGDGDADEISADVVAAAEALSRSLQ